MIVDLKEYNEKLRKIFDDPDIEPIRKLDLAIKYTKSIDKLSDGAFLIELPI